MRMAPYANVRGLKSLMSFFTSPAIFFIVKASCASSYSQIPRYIVTLHELLSHTPQNHVERRSLDEARRQLEQLSRQMQDEVG